MSAFLGPVHFWMYGKLKKRENLIQAVIKFKDGKYGSSDTEAVINEKCGAFPAGNLEEIIDLNNIHGSLSELTELSEKRLACAAAEILNTDKNTCELERIFYENGNAERAEYGSLSNCDEIFKAIGSSLADGMPCDSGINVLNQNDSEIMWEVNPNVHIPFWEKSPLSVSLFFDLRDAWLRGFFSNIACAAYARMGENIFKMEEI